MLSSLAASMSKQSWRGLTGIDRAALYAVAFSTGFRAEELSRLTPRSFQLDAVPPVAVLLPEQTKKGKGARQPLPSEVASLMADHLDGKPAGSPVWAGAWFKRAADMPRIDLEVAGIPYTVEGPSGQPVYCDFHATRHTFIALLDRVGVSLRQAMQLARHSDPRLTMTVYGQAGLAELGGTVDKLPSVAYTPLTQESDGRGGKARGTDGEGESGQEGEPERNPLQSKEFEGERGNTMVPDEAPRV